MKGMLFRAYMDFAQTVLSPEMVDAMLSDDGLSSGGAFTSVGNYPHSDLMQMNRTLAEELGITAGQALCDFGIFLFPALATTHVSITSQVPTLEALLLNIEDIIHRDVRKIYPDARPPMFSVVQHNPGHSVTLEYASDRAMAELAQGILIGALRHFGFSEKNRLRFENRSEDRGSSLFEIHFGDEERVQPDLGQDVGVSGS